MVYLALQKKRNNNRGFSLVELIIVIAIMVALIAVMGPTYIKYIQKSRDAAMKTAAEDVCAFAKTEYAARELDGTGKIKIYTNDSGIVTIEFSEGNITYQGKSSADGGATLFSEQCGLDTGRAINTNLIYYVIIENANGGANIVKTEDASFEIESETQP